MSDKKLPPLRPEIIELADRMWQLVVEYRASRAPESFVDELLVYNDTQIAIIQVQKDLVACIDATTESVKRRLP